MENSGCHQPHLKQLLGAYELGLLSGDEARLVEEHVLACDDCFEDLYETAALMKAARGSVRRRKKAWKWRVPALAAAGVVLAFSITYHLLSHGPEAKRGDSGNRYAISLRGPEGIQQGDRIVFEWEPAEESATYILSIFNETGDSVWACETRTTECVLPRTGDMAFHAGAKYYWKVVGEDDLGRPAAISPVTSFSIGTD